MFHVSLVRTAYACYETLMPRDDIGLPPTARHAAAPRRARIRCSTSTAPHNMQVIPIIYTPALHHIIIMVNVKLGYELHLTYPSVKMGFNALLRLIGSASVVSKHNNVSLVNCYVWVQRMPVVPTLHDGVSMI